MRIDLNHFAASQLGGEASTKKVSGQNAAVSDANNSEDRTTLSSGSASLQSLVSTAMNTPEVRQDLVDNLRMAINNGQYKLDPSAIASSMLDEQA